MNAELGGAPRTPHAPRPTPHAPWLLAIRPKTLPAAAGPVLVGTAVAHAIGEARWLPALAALAGALLLQIVANLSNDVFDHERGADTEHRLGPTRVVQSGLLTAAAVKRATLVAIGLAVLVGLYLAAVGGWPVVAIGVASILAALAYTGGPYPLGYNGLGDIFVLIFFGFVAVCGTVWVQALELPALAWWASVPPGVLAVAILVVNNVRDIDSDAAAGKRTLAVRLGRKGAVAEYALMVGVAYAIPIVLAATGRAGAWVLLPLLSLPLAIRRYHEVRTLVGRPLNRTLAGTGQLLFLHSALFAAGIALDGAAGP